MILINQFGFNFFKKKKLEDDWLKMGYDINEDINVLRVIWSKNYEFNSKTDGWLTNGPCCPINWNSWGGKSISHTNGPKLNYAQTLKTWMYFTQKINVTVKEKIRALAFIYVLWRTCNCWLVYFSQLRQIVKTGHYLIQE